MQFGLKDKDLQTIVEVLQKEETIEQAKIFGSRAKGNFKNGSDVDIVLIGKNLGNGVAIRVSYSLNEETTMPYQFDVLNYLSIENEELLSQINRVGKVFYTT